MKKLNLVIWTNSGMALALAEFPLYIAKIRGNCKRHFLDKSLTATVAISSDLVLKNRLLATLLPAKKQESLRMITDILRAQPRNYDIKVSSLDCRWFDEGNNVHGIKFKRGFHLATRTVEDDYEAGVSKALFDVSTICAKAGLDSQNQKPSFLVSTIDMPGDELYHIVGTQLWSRNPLSKILYGAVERTVRRRGVQEYKVVELEKPKKLM